MSTDDSQILCLRPDVIASVLMDGAAMLDLETKFFYSLNDSGWAIVQLLESGSKTEFIIEQCQVHGATEQDIIEVIDFIQILEKEHLVTPTADFEVSKLNWEGSWKKPIIEKAEEPLQRLITSAFDPTMPLAE